MTKHAYIKKRFAEAGLELIERCNKIIEEYQKQGYTLTLRQLFYQLVARGLLPNTVKDYKRLGGLVSDGRLAGLISWDAIEDRTRNLHQHSSWSNPGEIVATCARQYKVDRWHHDWQKYRPEVWVEKEALAGVFAKACQPLQVPHIACRGYMSQSEMWAAAQRFLAYEDDGQIPFILHFGDLDASGWDMSRDITERIELFTGDSLKFERLALNIEQVRKYNPPPNPAKLTDSRVGGYLAKFGGSSWELDALDPTMLGSLVTKAIKAITDQSGWDAALAKEAEERRLLGEVSKQWNALTKGL